MPDPDRVQRTRLDLARQASAPAAPPTGAERFYVDAAGALRQKSANGSDAAAGGGGIAQGDIDAAIAALVAGAPAGLNTLDELAAALGDDASFATTVASALSGKQPLDADLTAIAALTTTSYGRAFLALADAAAARTALALGTAAVAASGDFQPIDADLTAIATLTTTSIGRSLLAIADAAAGRTVLGLGTAALAASGDFQPIDSDLTAIAALSTTSVGRSLLAMADAAAGRTILGLGSAALLASTALPGTELAYVEFTASVNVTATVEASATSIVSAGAIVFDGSTAVEIEFFSPSVVPQPTADAQVFIHLFDGSTPLGYSLLQTPVATNILRMPGTVKRRLTPSAASHTYSFRATTSSGTATIGAGAGGSGTAIPGFIRVKRV